MYLYAINIVETITKIHSVTLFSYIPYSVFKVINLLKVINYLNFHSFAFFYVNEYCDRLSCLPWEVNSVVSKNMLTVLFAWMTVKVCYWNFWNLVRSYFLLFKFMQWLIEDQPVKYGAKFYSPWLTQASLRYISSTYKIFLLAHYNAISDHYL